MPYALLVAFFSPSISVPFHLSHRKVYGDAPSYFAIRCCNGSKITYACGPSSGMLSGMSPAVFTLLHGGTSG